MALDTFCASRFAVDCIVNISKSFGMKNKLKSLEWTINVHPWLAFETTYSSKLHYSLIWKYERNNLIRRQQFSSELAF